MPCYNGTVRLEDVGFLSGIYDPEEIVSHVHNYKRSRTLLTRPLYLKHQLIHRGD